MNNFQQTQKQLDTLQAFDYGSDLLERYAILVLLNHGAMPMMMLAEMLHRSRTSTTMLVDRLQEQGIAVRKHGRDDRRTVIVSLQPAVYNRLEALWRDAA